MKFLNFISAKVKTFFYPAILLFLCIILISLNHTPNTILSGWDTLHPEFNFSLNFGRLISGVFREEQGLGAVAAHAHMSDLPRVFLLWLSSFIFPMEFLRFFIISSCLPVGVLGVFYFLKDVIFKDRKSNHFAFLGSLFYLFNLGTLQHFYVPFEMFTVGYAAIPWLFWSVSRYLMEPSKKTLAIFTLTTLFASPMAYAPILWYVYFGSLMLFLLLFIKTKFKLVKNVVIYTLLINSFWILPNLYFIFSGNAAFVPEARINKIFSEEAYSLNQSYGDIADSLTFKNFLFDWPVYEGRNQFVGLLDVWKSYNSNFFITFLGIVFAELFLIGLILAFTSKNIFLKALITPFAFCFIFLINSTWPFAQMFDLLRDHFSLFKEALRFPFTKFSVVVMFITSVFFAFSIKFFADIALDHFHKLRKFLAPTLVALFSILFIVYMFPFFQGELISKKMQLQIPGEYFEVFNYLNKEPDFGRVAVFPVNTFWGWVYYNFGFQGAQFISFGIDKPLLDRDYDRWNPKNEQYYQEIAYAVYTKNIESFENVLNKYQVKYLLIDKNIISPGQVQDQTALYIPEIKSMLEFLIENKKVILAKETKDLEVYKYTKDFKEVTGFDSINKLDFQKGSYETDLAIEEGNYLKTTVNPDQAFPFWPFYDNQNIANEELVKVSGKDIVLTSKDIKSLDLKNYSQTEEVIPLRLYAKRNDLGLTLKLNSILGEEKENYSIDIPLEFSSDETLVININETQTVQLKDLQAHYKFIGNVLINTKGLTNLAVYKKSDFREIEFSGSVIKNEPNFDYRNVIEENSLLKLCSASDKDQVFGFDVRDAKNIKIASKNSQSCLWIPLEKILNSENISDFKDLISYSFTSETGENIFGRVCVYDKSANRCLKEKKYISNKESFEDFFPINDQDFSKLDLVLYLDGINNQKLENFNYKNLKISLNKPVAVLSIDPKDLVLSLQTQNIPANDKGEMKIDYGNNWENISINFLESSHKIDNCGKSGTKIIERNLNLEKKYLEYKTLNGSNCDYFSLPLAAHNTGYLIKVTTQNLNGLPLRMCIANNFSKRCEAYLSLPKSLTPKTYLIAVPPTKDGGIGMDIHFDNYSVGNFETVNRISDLQVYPFPYKFITDYRIGNSQMVNSPKYQEIIISKLTPFIYKASAKENLPKYLTLNQSFDKGWFLLGGKDHYEYNGWGNIFEINNSGNTVWIIYLPAFLELGGLIILGAILLVFVINPYFPRIFWKFYYLNDSRFRKIFFSKSFRPFN